MHFIYFFQDQVLVTNRMVIITVGYATLSRRTTHLFGATTLYVGLNIIVPIL